MTMTEAVDAALLGDEKGYQYLYESTYSYNFYLAGKYLRNDQDAVNDVLQDSYIKAFNNLHQLEDPEKFPKWFSAIVTRTALNELRKKKAVLFSQMQDEDSELDFSDNFESDRIDEQPEALMDEVETKRLLQEMLDTLSDEQRLCIVMYYFEELSVREIAEELSVSENTVKSRLNYGRKNIKEKVLELEKKGTKLYSMLPIPFFLYLFKTDAKACEGEVAAGEFGNVLKSVTSARGKGRLEAYEKTSKSITSKAAKTIITGGIKKKIAVGILAIGVTTVGIVGIIQIINREEPEAADPQVFVEILEKQRSEVDEYNDQDKTIKAFLSGTEEETIEEIEDEQDRKEEGLDYEGELEIIEEHVGGTYLCRADQSEYELSVADSARMYLTTFSENADGNFQIMVPGSAFRELHFGYGVTYEQCELYDFAGEIFGNAIVENGEITYFNEYFRE